MELIIDHIGRILFNSFLTYAFLLYLSGWFDEKNPKPNYKKISNLNEIEEELELDTSADGWQKRFDKAHPNFRK